MLNGLHILQDKICSALNLSGWLLHAKIDQ